MTSITKTKPKKGLVKKQRVYYNLQFLMNTLYSAVSYTKYDWTMSLKNPILCRLIL